MNVVWPLINHRYIALQHLTVGGTATVYHCYDTQKNGSQVALKVFDLHPNLNEEDAKKEYEILRRLNHPNLARVIDLGRIESIEATPLEAVAFSRPHNPSQSSPPPPAPGKFFIASEYIEGTDLVTAFKNLGTPEPPSLKGEQPLTHKLIPESHWLAFNKALYQLCCGLESIHSLGLIHRDLNPKHLLLKEQSKPNGELELTFEAFIIDFGLAADQRLHSGQRIQGTFPYIAPEILEGHPASPQSDLYSFGLSILQALLGGSIPENIQTETYFQSPQNTPELPWDSIPESTPPELVELIRSLTSPDITDRPSNTSEVRRQLESIAQIEKSTDPQPTQQQPPHLGWEDQLSRIRLEIERLRYGQPSHPLLLIESHDDAYEERLIEGLSTLTKLSNIDLYRGQSQRPSWMPFQALSETLTPLLRGLDLTAPIHRRSLALAAPVLPSLSQQSDTRLTGEAEPGEAPHQIADSLTELLVSRSQQSPYIILLDQLQEADADTLNLLEILAQNLYRRTEIDTLETSIQELLYDSNSGDNKESLEESSSNRPLSVGKQNEARVLFIGVYKSTPTSTERLPNLEIDESPWKSHWVEAPFCQHLTYRPLSREECRTWLEWRHGDESQPISTEEVDRLWELSQGLPRQLDQQVQSDPENFENQNRSLESKFNSLDDQQKVLLEALSILQAPVRIQQFGHWLEGKLDPTSKPNYRLLDQLQQLVQADLLTITKTPSIVTVDWWDPRDRKQILQKLDPDTQHKLYQSALSYISEHHPSDDGEISVQLSLEADDWKGYLETSQRVATHYQKAQSLRVASQLLTTLLEKIHQKHELDDDVSIKTEKAIRSKTLFSLALIYQRLGEASQAIEYFDQLIKSEDSTTPTESQARAYRLLGEAYLENDDQVNANYCFEESLSILEKLPPSEEIIETLLALSEFNLKRGQVSIAENFSVRALEATNQKFDPEAYSRTCLQLGKTFAKSNNHTKSIQYFHEAAEGAREAQNLPKILKAHQALGLAQMSFGDYDKAIEQFSRGIELATLLQSRRSLARLYNHLGTIQFNRANPTLALENYGASLKMFNQIGDPKGIANCYNNIGLALCLRDNLPQAADCYRRSIELFTRLGDQHGQAAGMNNLANILELQGHFSEALDYAFRSLEKRKRFKSRSGIAFSHYRIGKIYQSQGELEKATAHCEKALELRRSIGEKMGIANSKIQLAELLFSQGRIAEAQARCEEGEQEFKLLENRYGRAFARELLSRIAIELGDLDKATRLLEDALSRARQGEQKLLTGKALFGLGVVALEEGDFREAELRLDRAEALFRDNKSQRALTELLLEKARLSLETDQPREANRLLNATYDLLEELGIRDLNSKYFLLRGRLEAQSSSSPDNRQNRFFTRSEVEAADIPTILWKVKFYSGLAEEDKNPERAQEHFEEAAEILAKLREELGEDKTPLFYSTRERRLLSSRLTQSEWSAESEAPHRLPLKTDLPLQVQRELQELRHQNRRLLKFQEINKALNTEANLRHLLEHILDAVLDLMSAERGFLILRPSGPSEEEITIARNMAGETIENPNAKMSHSICEEVLRTAQPILTTSAVSDDRFIASKSVQDLRLLSVLCLPLKSGTQSLGALYLDNRSRQQAFEERDLHVLETFCDQATNAIRSAHLSNTLRKKNSELVELNARMEKLNHRLQNEVEVRTKELEQSRKEARFDHNQRLDHSNFPEIVGQSSKMLDLFELLERVAPTSLPVLVCGESGTGKELVARAIHAHSLRKEARFISENCAALSDSLLESELFGHERGAFTGATSTRKGLFELAHGGTLFLDEVAEMSLAMQKKLLRVLQEGELRRVGGKDTIQIDVRILCAANRDLRDLVKEGKFREDLYFRLNGLRLILPPLRERIEDIPHLAEHFLKMIAEEASTQKKTISSEAMDLLKRYTWPGNVRELKHFFERSALLLKGDHLQAKDCQFEDPSQILPAGTEQTASQNGAEDLETALFGPGPEEPTFFRNLANQPLREARDQFTKYYVEKCYRENEGNVTQAAKACEMSRESFHRFLKKFGIKR